MSILSRINDFPIIKTDRLVIDKITNDDANEYNRLCLDKELNKYFLDDNIMPTEETFYENYFVDIVKSDFSKRECLSLAIRYNNKFIGEVLLYNEMQDNSLELGIRIFDEYSGNGFGTETVKAMMKYSFEILKLDKLRLKCLKVNDKMKGIQKLFDKINEDDSFIYLAKKYGEKDVC